MIASHVRIAVEVHRKALAHAATPEEAMEDAILAYLGAAAGGAGSAVPAEASALAVRVLASHGVSLARAQRADVRSPDVLAARDEALHVVRAVFPGVKLGALARFFKRDHSSLSRALAEFGARLPGDDVLAARVARVVASARAGGSPAAPRSSRVPESASFVVEAVAQMAEVDVGVLLGHERSKHLTRWRGLAAHLLTKHGHGSTVVGLAINRDHSTAARAARVFAAALPSDPEMRDLLARMEQVEAERKGAAA